MGLIWERPVRRITIGPSHLLSNEADIARLAQRESFLIVLYKGHSLCEKKTVKRMAKKR